MKDGHHKLEESLEPSPETELGHDLGLSSLQSCEETNFCYSVNLLKQPEMDTKIWNTLCLTYSQKTESMYRHNNKRKQIWHNANWGNLSEGYTAGLHNLRLL